jgi:hypothetical protein
VEEAQDGGYVGRAVGADIFTETDDATGLQAQVRDAVRCHFDNEHKPRVGRLPIIRSELISA